MQKRPFFLQDLTHLSSSFLQLSMEKLYDTDIMLSFFNLNIDLCETLI